MKKEMIVMTTKERLAIAGILAIYILVGIIQAPDMVKDVKAVPIHNAPARTEQIVHPSPFVLEMMSREEAHWRAIDLRDRGMLDKTLPLTQPVAQ